MAMAKTQFDPQRNGLNFPNQLELPFPMSYQLPFAGSVDLKDVVTGLCGGMCFTALDYYHSGEMPPVATQEGQIDQSLLTYLWDRHLDSLKPLVVLKVI